MSDAIPSSTTANPLVATDVSERLIATAKPWELLSLSRSQWYKLASSGKTPAPIHLGTRKPLWSLDELRSWFASGCPDRQAWEKQKRKSGR
jgi:predicted DNA-binding transcriptional regulator AlpA